MRHGLFVSLVTLGGWIILAGPTGCSDEGHRGGGNTIILTEGVGVERVAVLGDRASKAKKALGPIAQKTKRGQRGSVEDTGYEFRDTPVTIDTLDEGSGEVVARVSVFCGQNAPQASPSVVRTKAGLELLPARATREAVLSVYGNPMTQFTNLFVPELCASIKQGHSYAVVSATEPGIEYIHYPDKGIAFLLQSGQVVKCYVEARNRMLVWRY